MPSCAFLATSATRCRPSCPRRTVDHARRLQRRAAAGVDLDEAHAAHADRLHPLVVAEARDVDAVALGGLDDQLALAGDDRLAVDRQARRRSGSAAAVASARPSASAASCRLVRHRRLRAVTGIMVARAPILRLELVAEQRERRVDRRVRRRADEADRGHLAGTARPRCRAFARRVREVAGADGLADVEQLVEVGAACRGRRRCAARIRSSHVPPSRHGVHLPHDSWAKNRTSVSAATGMSVVSSITIDRAGAEHRAGRADELALEREVEVLRRRTTAPSRRRGRTP